MDFDQWWDRVENIYSRYSAKTNAKAGWYAHAESIKESMRLPDNKTCSDCKYFIKCSNLFGHAFDDTICDWCPSRFKEVV